MSAGVGFFSRSSSDTLLFFTYVSVSFRIATAWVVRTRKCTTTRTGTGGHVLQHVSLTPFMLSILPIIPILCPVPRMPHYSHYYAGIFGAP
ncbi:hypothetical protein GBAR_LOCUS23039, partial [Geodia barretti]